MALNPESLKADIALISSLGGVAELARRLGCSDQVVSNWKKRGIPAKVKLTHPDLFLPKAAAKALAKAS